MRRFVRPSRAALAVLAGALGGLLFLFVFPAGSISTFMHQVLHLPGPGAGIALIVGPVALVFVLISSRLAPGTGSALLAALAFSLVYAVLVAILGLPVNEKGMFGSVWFVAAFATCGVAAEVLLYLARNQKPSQRFALAAGGANLVLLLFYWVVIFPRTAGWIAWGKVPLLLVLSLAGGLAAGATGWILSNWIRDLVGLDRRR